MPEVVSIHGGPGPLNSCLEAVEIGLAGLGGFAHHMHLDAEVPGFRSGLLGGTLAQKHVFVY